MEGPGEVAWLGAEASAFTRSEVEGTKSVAAGQSKDPGIYVDEFYAAGAKS